MNLWSRIRQLKLQQLIKLSVLFLSRPFLIGPTLRATKRTMAICDDLFERLHHKSNKENAFRHALWNFLICQKTLKRTKNSQKSAIWAQKVTKMYEKVTNNSILEKSMDLHNNAIGRMIFLDKNGLKEPEIIDFLQKMMQNAQKIAKTEEIEKYKTEMVFLEES